MKIEIFNGEGIAESLTAFGLPCKFVNDKVAPQIIIYYLDLKNINNYSASALNKAIEKLSLFAKTKFYILDDTQGISHIAIYYEREEKSPVMLGSLETPMQTDKTEFIAGTTQDGEQLNISLDDMVHCLIAGTTGSGKSVFLKSLLYSLSANSKTDKLQYAIIDKKRILNYWNKLAFCLKVGNTDVEALQILNYFHREMTKRYKEMETRGIEKNNGDFPKMVLIIDELADLMLTDLKEEIEEILVSLCQLGRAAGIHCILCTQTPRVTVVSGLIQANTPTKIIFKTTSARESVLCLGHKGAEQLLGAGDCIIRLPQSVKEYRIQAPFETNENFKRAVCGGEKNAPNDN